MDKFAIRKAKDSTFINTSFYSIFILALLLTGNTASAQSSSWLYSVRPGDTLWDLCEKYTTKPDCWQTLGSKNGIKYPRKLPPGFLVSFPVSWLKLQPTPVIASYASGQVSVVTHESTTVKPVNNGDKLTIGSLIRTGEGSVTLNFGSGGQMLLEKNSELLLDTMSSAGGEGFVDTRLRLNKGSIKTKVPLSKPRSRFSISTPAAVAAVRGTEFHVSYNNNNDAQMRSAVFNGLVAVSTSKAEEDIPSGFGIVATKGEALKPPIQLLDPPTFSMPEHMILPGQINWSTINQAEKYLFEIFNDNNQEQLLLSSVQNVTSYTLDNLVPACYRARVRGIDSNLLRGIAANQKFCVSPFLAAPDSSTFQVSTKVDNAITISWAAVDGAAQYVVQTSPHSSFERKVSTIVSSQPSVELNLDSNDPIHIRIQSVGKNDEKSSFSNSLEWVGSQTDKIIAIAATVLVILLML